MNKNTATNRLPDQLKDKPANSFTHDLTDNAAERPRRSVETIIIGAGAAGLFCALSLGKLGRKVLVLDHANKAGKKILMSGGGRCNFTNQNITASHYLSNNPHFVKSALARFDHWQFMAFIYRHQIDFEERAHGQLFCTHSSKDILQMLLLECEMHGVEIVLQTKVNAITSGLDFLLQTEHTKRQQKMVYHCRHLVIATGGLSIPTMGATGFGYEIARQFGHQIIPTRAGLVPFVLTDKVGALCESLSGVSLEVAAFNERARFVLPMLFTHRGLSGPAILQLSSYWQVGEPIFIDLCPSERLAEFLCAQKTAYPKRLIRTALMTLTSLPKKVIGALESFMWQAIKDVELANIKDDDLIVLGNRLNAWRIVPSGTEGYRTAEVTLGGVDCNEVSSKSMQSLLCERLYFIGEVLDVAGQLGGYNFHWAWASAYACASAIADEAAVPANFSCQSS